MKVKIVKLKNIFEETDHYLVIENEKTGERYTEKKSESVALKIEEVINGKLDKTTGSEPEKQK